MIPVFKTVIRENEVIKIDRKERSRRRGEEKGEGGGGGRREGRRRETIALDERGGEE